MQTQAGANYGYYCFGYCSNPPHVVTNLTIGTEYPLYYYYMIIIIITMNCSDDTLSLPKLPD